MNVGWCFVEVGKMGSDQLLHGPEGLDEFDDVGRLDVATAELPRVSIHLETSEVPFQQSGYGMVPVEAAGRDWRVAVADTGKWPLVALGAAAVLVAVFAAFISRNGQQLSSDREAADTAAAVESASASVGAEQLAGTPSQVELDASGRSTGTLGPGEGGGFFSGQVVEPDRSLTDADIDWTPATVPTTAPPTTAANPLTEATSTTEATTTLPPTSETTTPSTTAEPSGSWVRAIGPGSADEQNPAVVSGKVTLEAEGSDESMRYRFFVYARTDDGEWRQVDRSGWRSDPEWKIKTKSFDGRTVRWTVVAVTRFRDETAESAPLYLVAE